MLIDTHAHLNFKAFENDLEKVIGKAKEAGVEKIINVGANLDSSKKAIELASLYPNLYATAGIHPHHADIGGEPIKNIDLLIKNDKVVAIGEIGLDYHEYASETKPGNHTKTLQKKVFLSQIDLAKKSKLPVVFHSRESIKDLLPLVAQLKKSDFSDLRGVFHCWSETLDFAKETLDLGFYLSFTANITYPKNEYLREVVRFIPLEFILLETDSPFLPSHDNRGLRNTPSTVKIIAQTIADLKGLSFSKVAAVTTQNATNLFKLG